MKFPKGLGFILLAIWLIAEGAILLLGLSFNGMHYVRGLLAIAAGVLILVER
ncbi:MAG TPA: hypothetical protein VGY77_10525 [Gemmataceae bacterium]|jgi:hypothetical protein|nr:hypothetical protein [Gemmataceae bacterium]